ncbi:serine protease inhibitor 42Dd-like isoform X2 [Contarinia nasturtii]|nr:serine protease inhibitor 42Dd-like isoform X2 [Contarinia nasturtii]
MYNDVNFARNEFKLAGNYDNLGSQFDRRAAFEYEITNNLSRPKRYRKQQDRDSLANRYRRYANQDRYAAANTLRDDVLRNWRETSYSAPRYQPYQRPSGHGWRENHENLRKPRFPLKPNRNDGYKKMKMSSGKVNITNLTEGICNFAADIYKECTKSTRGDVIISPLSIAVALGLLAQGANGNTYDELRKGLHLTHDKETIANQFVAYFELLHNTVGQSTFSIANRLYIQSGHQINRHFQEVAVKKFSSGIESLNFAQSAESAAIINHFVESKTNGKIKDLINPYMLNAQTRLVLVNAIYFKGNWEHQFDPRNTEQGHFYVSETKTVPVNFMSITKKFNHAVLDELDATAVEMNYANSNFSFMIVLPNKRTGLSTLENRLQNYDLAKITKKMHSTK